MSLKKQDASRFINDNRRQLREAMQLAMDNAPRAVDRAYWRQAMRAFDRIEKPEPASRQTTAQKTTPPAHSLQSSTRSDPGRPLPGQPRVPAPMHRSIRQTCHLIVPTAALSVPGVVDAIVADTRLAKEIVEKGQGGTARAHIDRDVSPASSGMMRITAYDIAHGVMSETETTLERYGVSFDAFSPGSGDRLTNVRWLREGMDSTRQADVHGDGMGLPFTEVDTLISETKDALRPDALRGALQQARPHFEYLSDPIERYATPNAGMVRTLERPKPARDLPTPSSSSSMG